MSYTVIYLEGSLDNQDSFEEVLNTNKVEIYDVTRIYEQGSFVIVENLGGEIIRVPQANVRYIHEKGDRLNKN